MQSNRFEIPDQMRQMADQSVSEARKAFEQFLDVTQKAVAQTQGSTQWVGEGTIDLSRQALAYLEENVAASFDLAQRLVQARTIEEVAALQQEFVRRQIAAAAEQGKTLASMAARAANETVTKPKK